MKDAALKPTFVFATVLTLILCRPALAENADLVRGIDKFRAGEYSEAADLFRKAETNEPENALLHYYFAESLVKLNQINDAIREYRTAQSLAPNTKIASFSKTALTNLGASSAVSSQPQAASLKSGTAKEAKANEWLSSQIQQLEDQRKVKLAEVQKTFAEQFDVIKNETAAKKSEYTTMHFYLPVGSAKGMVSQEVYDSSMAAFDQEGADKQLEITKKYKRKQQEINAGFFDKEKALRDSLQVGGTGGH